MTGTETTARTGAPVAQITTSAGTLDYVDTGGAGPTVVLLHGILMDHTLWDGVVQELGAEHRCVVPTLPFGAHHHPVAPGTDLSLTGIASLVLELLDLLDLRDVVLVGNDTGGAVAQLVAVQDSSRLAGLALVSCDAFDNVPPGLTGRTIVALGRLSPRAFGLCMQQMRMKPMRRLPLSFGRLTRRGDRVVRRWLEPVLHDQAIRRDAVHMLRAVGADRDVLVRADADLRRFDRPAIVVWAAGDRVMPPEHGVRLAEMLGAELVVVDDTATLVPLDQPAALAAALRGFAAVTA